MPAFQKTPKEIEDYVIAHINDRPRTKVAEHCGISLATVYRIVREHGGELRSELTKKRDGIEKQITELYPSKSLSEIAKEVGVGKTTVGRWVKKLNLQHTPDTIKRLKQKTSKNLDCARRNIDYTVVQKKRSRTRRIEEWRVKSGLPQQTKFKIKIIPKRVYQAMWHLKSKYDYFFDTDSTTLYYDSQTNRRPNEQYYINKYGIKFERADE